MRGIRCEGVFLRACDAVQVPPETYELMSHAQKQGAEAEKKWDESWAQYKEKYPEVCSLP